MSTSEVRRILAEMILYMEYLERHSMLLQVHEKDYRQLIKNAREAWNVLVCTKEREL